MNGRTPVESQWCNCCWHYTKEEPGYRFELCEDHRGPDGQPKQYDGGDLYKPSEWVLTVVGEKYRGWDERVYECFGYDIRAGFWMRTTDDGPLKISNISERAIGRTYHRIVSWAP